MDKIFLIGHRGVGKTTILKDFSLKSKDHVCLDLDLEIESREKIDIHELFNNGHQKKFRQLELKVLKDLVHENKNKSLVIALGAGFELEKFIFPKGSIVLWLRRSTDPLGRIFFNRPSLFAGDPSKPSLDPLVEWEKIFKVREQKYNTYSNAKLLVPEYFDKEINPLLEYLKFKSPDNGFLTYIPNENDFIAQRQDLKLELRTDIVSADFIFDILKNGSSKEHLISVRNFNGSFLKKLFVLKESFFKTEQTSNVKDSTSSLKNRPKRFLIDWDIKLGLPSKDQLKFIDIFSSHGDHALEDVLKFNFDLIFEYGPFLEEINFDPHFKLCPKVESHEEAIYDDVLLQRFFKKDSYSYLPRSNEKLDLSYFRQLKSSQQKIGFYRFSDGSSLDQPLWWQWPQKKPKGFYGINGQNIKHSFTPSFHKKFFTSKNLSPLSIDSLNMIKDHKDYFHEQGLKTLAVTSPYKHDLYLNSKFKGTIDVAEAKDLKKVEILDFKSANTLILTAPGKIAESFNTDYVGLKLFTEQHLDPNLSTIVWGGGALLEQLKKLLPQALFYSAQTGKLRDKSQKVLGQNFQLIWASGEKGLNPKFIKDVNIKKIIDLDYRENSKARLYSYRNKIDYVSGLDFFIEQAKAQQSIWEHYEF